MLNINSSTLSATSHEYGQWRGASLQYITLENASVTVALINLGATITAIYVPGRDGIKKNIVAGFEDLNDYKENPAYFGCIVGRYANRIAGGRLTIDGINYQLPINNGPNHLHGGHDGFHLKVWQVVGCSSNDQQASVTMTYTSADGEEGYPGNLTTTVTYTLDNSNRLHITYMAHTDKSTVINLTNHSYFNLSGFEDALVTKHLLQVNAGTYTEKNASNTPTGNILPVKGTPLDFTRPVALGKNINLLPADMGYDHNFILRPYMDHNTPAAILEDPASGRILRVYTDQPGIQVYSANYWDGSIIGAQGKPYLKHGAVALETQAFPDSPNHAHFPSTLLIPGEEYQRMTVFAFDVQ